MHTQGMRSRIRLLIWLLGMVGVLLPGRFVLRNATAQSIPPPAHWVFHPACDGNGAPCRPDNIPPCGPAPWTNSAGNATCGAGTVVATKGQTFKVCGTPNASTTPCPNISVICGSEAVCTMHVTGGGGGGPLVIYCSYAWTNVYASGCAQ